MLSFNGVSAWIEVDGKELEQYGVEEDLDKNQVTCWIATQANKSFSIAFRDNAAYREHSLSSALELDGSSVKGYVLPPARFEHFSNFARDRTMVQSGQTSSATSSRPFMFSKLELTDEDDDMNQPSTHLGEIRIRIYKVQLLETHALFQPGSSVSGHGKIHERSKKAVTQCVSYGQEVRAATTYGCRVRYLDNNSPLATFIFKYRDSSLLLANGIIPKAPAAKKAAVAADVLDLTTYDDVKTEPVSGEVEIAEYATQKMAVSLLSKRSSSSRESEVRPIKKIKREKSSVYREVIDLT